MHWMITQTVQIK